MNLSEAIAVFDKSASRTTPNAQTQAWAVIRAELGRVTRDAGRWREVSNKAWFVDAAATVYELHGREYSYEPSQADEDDVTDAIDAALTGAAGAAQGEGL